MLKGTYIAVGKEGWKHEYWNAWKLWMRKDKSHVEALFAGETERG